MPNRTSSSFATSTSTCGLIFSSHRLEGTAELTVEQVDPDAGELNLDTRDLEIHTVHLIEASGRAKALAFKLAERDPILGSRLTIEFPHCCAATSQMRIRIAYRTSTGASALQWLEPAQTSGGRTRSSSRQGAGDPRAQLDPDPGHARGVRVTYGARIRTPPELVAVMSAAGTTESPAPASTASR